MKVPRLMGRQGEISAGVELTGKLRRLMMRRISKRAGPLLAGALVLSSCGFHPMLGEHAGDTTVAGVLAKVKVGYVEGRSGQVLRNDLVNALNPRGEPDHPEYTLTLRIEEPQQNLAFQRNNSVTNVGYSVIAYWTLNDQDGKAVFSSGSSSSQQYAISNSQYATAVSAQNVRDRIMADISSDIRSKLAQYFVARQASAAKTK